MRSASSGSVVTAWSGEMAEASISSEPSDSAFTRGAVWPRITGRLAPPPKVSLCTPGRPSSVSPNVPPRFSTSASPSSTEAGCVVLFRSSPSGLADTVTGASVAAASAWPAACWACAVAPEAASNAHASGRNPFPAAPARRAKRRDPSSFLHLDSYGCYIITNKNQMI